MGEQSAGGGWGVRNGQIQGKKSATFVFFTLAAPALVMYNSPIIRRWVMKRRGQFRSGRCKPAECRESAGAGFFVGKTVIQCFLRGFWEMKRGHFLHSNQMNLLFEES